MGLLDKLRNLPTMSEMKGGLGEQLTKFIAKIDIPETLVLHDILIDGAEDQTSQIDLLLIGAKGIYVVEVKMYTDARVYGDCKKSKWYYYKGGQKYEIYSPYKQNENHIKYLKKFLQDFGDVPCFSILALLCEDFKITNINEDESNPTKAILSGLLSLRKAVKLLAKDKPDVFTEEKKQEIFKYIQEHQYAGKEARREHKENVIAIKTAKEEEEKQNICPYCKTELVARKGKYGDFYGCSNYPKCKYTKKIQEG